ncbi:MAG: thiaminase II, partial [Armatimonadota bacterium]|nr:thiaminase II [Armatimonadota bacterium]
MRYTEQLWRSITPIYEAILRHPFLTGLTDGTLPREAFEFYVIQDAHYLRYYAQCLSLLAAKAPHDEWLVTFNEHAKTAILVERSLHESFFKDFGLTSEQVYATPLAPTCLAYTHYLLAVCYARPFHEALGAVLPCYWIYWEVGKALEQRGSPNPLYQRWIDTYASEEFGSVVRAVLEMTDATAETLTEAQRQAMQQHFITSSRYEWMFW